MCAGLLYNIRPVDFLCHVGLCVRFVRCWALCFCMMLGSCVQFYTTSDVWFHFMYDVIQTELVFVLAKNATKPNPFEIISLQTTKKKNNWKTEETLARTVVTLETERIKGFNPWWWCMMLGPCDWFYTTSDSWFHFLYDVRHTCSVFMRHPVYDFCFCMMLGTRVQFLCDIRFMISVSVWC